MNLYHPDVYLPESLVLPRGSFPVKHTNHAKMEALADGVRLPDVILMEDCKIFEIGMEKGRVFKLGLRLKYNEWLDLCLVVDTQKWLWKVITCWTNRREDRHASLYRNKYAFK